MRRPPRSWRSPASQSLADLLEKSAEELAEIPGIGGATAEKILEAAAAAEEEIRSPSRQEEEEESEEEIELEAAEEEEPSPAAEETIVQE